MSTIELRKELTALVQSIQNEQLLQAVCDLLNAQREGTDGALWASLTNAQKDRVLMSFEESENDSTLIDSDQVLRKGK